MTKLFIKKICEIKQLSFWNFEKGRGCILASCENSVVLSLKKEREFYSKYQVNGLLYHYLEEIHSKGKLDVTDYDNFLQHLDNFKSKYIDKFEFDCFEDLDEWSEVQKAFDHFADDTTRSSNEKSSAILHFEKEIKTKSGLVGRPDLVVEESGSITLVEFKSGSLYDENNFLKEEYVRQLHFYSSLLNAKFGEYPSKLILKSLKDGYREVIFDRKLADQLLKEAENFLVDLKKLEGENVDWTVANPTQNNCRYCSIRQICPKFISNQSRWGDEVGYTAVGKLSSIASSGKTFGSVLLDTDEGEKRIENIPVKKIKDIGTGVVLAFNNLKLNSNGSYNYKFFSELVVYG